MKNNNGKPDCYRHMGKPWSFNLFYSLSLIYVLSSKNIDCKYCAHYWGIFSVECDGVISFTATNFGKTIDVKTTEDKGFFGIFALFLDFTIGR